jgi:hydrogenase maturation factor
VTAPDTAPACHGHPQEGCITCGDEAVVMHVRRIDADRALALCEAAAGEQSTVEIALVTPVQVGDALLVHAGTAIAHASEEAA